MKPYEVAQGAFYGLFVFASGQAVYFYSKLPDRMATHFDAAGNANGYSSKVSFMISYFALLLFYIALFELIEWVIGRVPDRWVNLPNKTYWLAEVRRADTLAYLKVYTRWIGVFMMGFFCFLLYSTFQVNLGKAQMLSLYPIYIILAFMFLSILALYWRFRLPKNVA